MQAIILAGGLGTRLRAVVPNIPKPMAPIHGKPFLAYLLSYLKQQGFQHVVLSVYYLREQIQAYFQDQYQGLTISYAVESEPLGTGGAITNALQEIKNEELCFVLNGDTFAKVNYVEMLDFQQAHLSSLSIALCQIPNCYRYGQVQFDSNLTITKFSEQGENRVGWINTGVYLLNRSLFSTLTLPKKFSFEKDFLQQHTGIIKPKGFIASDYFIDIGVPEDYARAQKELVIHPS